MVGSSDFRRRKKWSRIHIIAAVTSGNIVLPAVIDVVVARTGLSTAGIRMERNAEFYMRLAVFNAKGDQLIDLANTSPWADL